MPINYKWMRNGIVVSEGPSNSQYELSVDDFGCTISCLVTDSNSYGTIESTATKEIRVIKPEISELGEPILATPPPPGTAIPEVSSYTIDELEKEPEWDGVNVITCFGWYVNGRFISSSLSADFVLNDTIASGPCRITCVVRGANRYGFVDVAAAGHIDVVII
jgi:hypothetical protein